MKRIDMTELPDGFLIQVKRRDGKPFWFNNLDLMSGIWREGLALSDEIIRPALNHWNFNDGTMTLPDGLVVEFRTFDYSGDGTLRGCTHDNSVVMGSYHRFAALEVFELNEHPCNPCGDTDEHEVIAVKILGVTEEYAEHGKELGMDVIILEPYITN